ncbi:endonuclease NucS domain-containing protein [Serratia sp. CY56464]|uniref:endonuclease NucS domain-containing protein n=1 Tax=Serratia sp. CY56464 TaxID=3383641 RepID=UPI003F9FF0AC
MIIESDLRDLIYNKIEIISHDLTVIEKEKYIPNTIGTRGFIDIYAKDKNNNHVIIELKRSNQTARQALHEVIKYAEGIKSHFGATDGEIRIIIASTEWNELLVPFSHLVHKSPFSLQGVKINLDGKNITTESIEPLSYNKGRFISPYYTVYWYKDKISLNKGISSIKKIFEKSGINHFLLTVFNTEKPIPSPSKERRIAVLKEMAKFSNMDFIDHETELYSHIVFLSIQAISSEEQLDIIKLTKSEETYNDVLVSISDLDEDEKSDYLYEYTLDLEGTHYDDIEIGGTAKFSLYFNTQYILFEKIIREGFFSLNKNLTDETILNELKGNKGNSYHKLKCEISISDTKQLSILKEDIQSLLETNQAWQNQILQIINELEKNHPDSFIQIDIHHPRTALFSIYYTIKHGIEDGIYLPYYLLSLKDRDNNNIKNFYGCLQNTSESFSFDELIEKYYDGNISSLIFTMTWGGSDERDEEILDDAGLCYMSFFHDIVNDKKYSLINNKWRSENIKSILDNFLEFTERNHDLVNNLISEISFFDQGNIFSAPDIDTHIIIERSEVEAGDLSKIHDFMTFATSSFSAMRYFQGKVDISINGYDNDNELFMIDEVKDFLRKVNTEISYLFFFLNPNSPINILKILYLCFVKIENPIIHSNGIMEINITPHEEDIFFHTQFAGLNELTELCNMDLDKNKEITSSIMESIGIKTDL